MHGHCSYLKSLGYVVPELSSKMMNGGHVAKRGFSIGTQNGVRLLAAPLDDDDRTVADGESGSEQLRHLVRNRRGEGDRLVVHGIANVECGPSHSRERSWLNRLPY